MRNEPETLGDLIQSSGIGLRRAAKAANVGRTSIWRWCRGYAYPRHAQAAALAAVLGCEVDRVLAAATASQLDAATAGSQQGSAPAVV